MKTIRKKISSISTQIENTINLIGKATSLISYFENRQKNQSM